MWLLTWKKYKASKAATFISAIGALIRYGAVLCLVSALIPGFLVCAAIGVGMHYWAERIAAAKWYKLLAEQGYVAKIAAGDLQAAINVYNANPSKDTLNFIAKHNEKLAQEIQSRIKK